MGKGEHRSGARRVVRGAVAAPLLALVLAIAAPGPAGPASAAPATPSAAATQLAAGTPSAPVIPSAEAAPSAPFAEAAPAAAAAPAATAGSAGCVRTPHTTATARAIDVPGHLPVTRHYRLHVPAGLTGDSMLLLSLHGGGISALTWESMSTWSAEADDDGFVVAYPQGLANLWNSGSRTSADLAFLRAVVADVSARWCIDPDRVFIEGGSMGGWMAQRMLCHSPDVFAAAASGGAGHAEVDLNGNEFLWHYPCTPSRPVSVYLAMGSDDLLHLHGDALRRWRRVLGCPSPVPADGGTFGTLAVAWGCAGGQQVVYRTWTGLGHEPEPPSEVHQVAKDEVQAFFAAHPMP